jgi:hypothetical protein
MAGSKVRKETRDRRKKQSASYNKTPEMPKATKSGNFGAFRQGVGGSFSAKVGTRQSRRGDLTGPSKKRSMTDNYGSGTGSTARRIAEQARQDRKNK